MIVYKGGIFHPYFFKISGGLKNMAGINRTFSVELYTENNEQHVYLYTDGASGCDYKISSTKELGMLVDDYVSAYYSENYNNSNDWHIHFVYDESPIDGIINAHTHGLPEIFGHPDFQMVIGAPDEVYYIMGKLVNMVKRGYTLTNNTIIIGLFDNKNVLLKEYVEMNRRVLRVIIPDENDNMPEDASCMGPFKYQYIEFDK